MAPEIAPEMRRLRQLLRETALIESSAHLLGWDERTQLPRKGSAVRAEQLGYLARLRHERFTHPEIGDLLGNLEKAGETGGDDPDASAIREVRRQYDRARKLPGSLVEEISRTTSLAEHAWADARAGDDFAAFAPWLRKVFDLKRQEATCLRADGTLYDALLDDYEPRARSAQIAAVFASLRTALVDLIRRVVDSGRTPPTDLLTREFPVDAQARFGREAAAAVGFDFEAGRLDVTTHPFCAGIGPGDTRLTTRYNPRDFGDAFFSTIHEVGHGLYEQGLPKAEQFGWPLGDAVSLGIHESQSRMWENLVARSGAFWTCMFPRAQAAFPGALNGVSVEPWVAAVNAIRPSFIRVEADEATYNLHIMLRFELEQALLDGALPVEQLPGEWKARMREFLGVAPATDREGCLQDVHWSAGLVGYFPTYALGNLYAAQFFEHARKALGDLDAAFAGGRFDLLLGWLREQIHRHGRRYTADELVRRVCGAALSPEPLLRHLREKAARFYGV